MMRMGAVMSETGRHGIMTHPRRCTEASPTNFV
jgi:hypothetical protein